MKIVVLCGGNGAERIVSLASGDAVGGWLASAGYDVVKLNPTQPEETFSANQPMAPPEIGIAPPQAASRGFNPSQVIKFLEALEKLKPDLAFPILHGDWGENGTLQSLLEWIGLPYTGSAPLACALAMHKQKAKELWQPLNILTPKGIVVPFENAKKEKLENIFSEIGFPAVCKPLNGGSTVGLTIIRKPNEIARAVQAVVNLSDDVLIEQYIDGREMTVVMLNGEPLPVIEIRPHEGFYDYHNKYTSGRSDYICPAPIEDTVRDRMQKDAVNAYHSLGCSGFARVDFLLNSNNEAYCLELNTLPGMTQHSLVPKAAKAAGIEPPELVDRIVKEVYAKRA